MEELSEANMKESCAALTRRDGSLDLTDLSLTDVGRLLEAMREELAATREAAAEKELAATRELVLTREAAAATKALLAATRKAAAAAERKAAADEEVAEARQTLTEEKLRRAEKRASMAEATAASLSELALRQQRQLESLREKPSTVNNYQGGHFSGAAFGTVDTIRGGSFAESQPQFSSSHQQFFGVLGASIDSIGTISGPQQSGKTVHNEFHNVYGQATGSGQATVGDNASFGTKPEPARPEQQSMFSASTLRECSFIMPGAAVGGGSIDSIGSISAPPQSGEAVRPEQPPTVNNFSGHFSGGVHPTVTYDYSGVFGSVHGQGRTTVGDNATFGMKQPADTANHNYSGDFFGSSVAGGQATVGDNASFRTKQEPARQGQQSASEQQWAAIGGGEIAVPSAESHGDFK